MPRSVLQRATSLLLRSPTEIGSAGNYREHSSRVGYQSQSTATMINRTRLLMYCSVALVGAVALPFIKLGDGGPAQAAGRPIAQAAQPAMTVQRDDPKEFAGTETFDRL